MARYPNGVNYKFKKRPKPHQDRKVFVLMRLMKGHSTKEIAGKAGVSISCVAKIRRRETRYPQNLTADRIIEALDLHQKIFDKDGNEVEV